MSLVGSIFGEASTSSEAKPAENALSGLFDQFTSLPEKPKHKAAATKTSKRKEIPAQQDEPSKKKRKPRKPHAPETAKNDAIDEQKPSLDEAQEEDTVDDRTIFVGNLPLATTRKSLASLFKRCGKVESSRLRSVATTGVKLPPGKEGDQNLVKRVCANTNRLDKDAKSTSQGYVVFKDSESVAEALKLNNTVVDGLRLRVDHATPTRDASQSVFVGNLPYTADETTLQQHFCKGCGLEDQDVEGVRIVRDKDTMQCKGFGYVLLREKNMVAVALQKMHESKYMKRELRVTVCGKRFKGKRGEAKHEGLQNRRSFEGKRSEVAEKGAMKHLSGKKEDPKFSKKRRARGERKPAKSGPKKAGVSKRAASEAKAGKRMKKIQKRVSKGMGKARGK